jgi:tetratricopeptide (TPR) repeat protein
MIYILGHDLYHEMKEEYIRWLHAYDSHIPEDLLNKAQKRLDDHDPVASIWMLQAAILLAPDQAESHYYLGLAYSQHALDLHNANQIEESDLNFYQAVRYLVNAAELDPQSGKAYYGLGFVFRRLGLDKESRKCLEKYIILGLEDGTYKSRGAMLPLPQSMTPP